MGKKLKLHPVQEYLIDTNELYIFLFLPNAFFYIQIKKFLVARISSNPVMCFKVDIVI